MNPWNALFTLAVQAADAAAEAATAAAEKATEATAAVADAAAKVAEDPNAGSTLSAVWSLLQVVLILGLPVLLGVVIAKALKMKEYAGRIGACLLALSIAVAPLAINLMRGTPLDEMLKLGIDLAGGANLVYEVQHSEEKPINDMVMDKMVGAVATRINPSGQEEITVRQVGADRIEVIVPGKDPETVDEIKRRIVRLGTLEFYITAHRDVDSKIVQRGEDLDTGTKVLVNGTGTVIARWLPAYLKQDEPKLLER
ncbi:MAG: hypothetical protein ABGZ35_12670, partial [Planctomycetaceae bacterium]